MDRTIKFRVWDTRNQNMTDSFFMFDLRDGKYVYYDSWRDFEDGIYFPCKVMQFTGLYDREGKEIWEGDVLEYKEYYAYIKWWSSVEEIPIIAERTEQQRQDFIIERREVRFNNGAFCLGYTPLEKVCRNNILVEKLESGKQFNGDYEKKQWDFKIIGNIYEHPTLLQ